LVRRQEVRSGSKGILGKSELFIRVINPIDVLDQRFNVGLLPLVLVGKSRDGELFRSDTLDLARGHRGEELSDILPVILIAIEPTEESIVILGVNDVILGDIHPIKNFSLVLKIIKEGFELFNGKGEGTTSIHKMIVSVFRNIGCLESLEESIESLGVNRVEGSAISLIKGRGL